MEPTLEQPAKRKRRNNAEIAADMKAERNKPPEPRKRRTNAEIERDKRIADNIKIKEELARVVTYNYVEFYGEVNAFGKLWQNGESISVTPDSYYYRLAFDRNNNFILNKTAEEQKDSWGEIRYRVQEVPL